MTKPVDWKTFQEQREFLFATRGHNPIFPEKVLRLFKCYRLLEIRAAYLQKRIDRLEYLQSIIESSLSHSRLCCQEYIAEIERLTK